MLELVWTNLLSNAVKFTPQGGSITLCQTLANGKIYVSVTDTGCGMALVKRILELTGAEMQIESTPGKGSTFTVVLAERK